MELSGILEIVLIVLVLGLFGFIALSGKGNAPDIEKKLEQDQLQRQNETERLERKVADLNKTIYEMQNNLNKGVLDMQNKMTRQLLENNEKTNFSFQKQFSESRQIMKESNKTITDITNRLAKFEETNKNVLSATDKLENLQNILLNPKQRGTFGEFQLESVLENIFAPNQWKAQYKFKNGEIVDAVVFLHDGYILPIDSKFSLENYNRMIECDNEQKAEYEKLVRGDLKGRIDETAKYIRPDEGTMDFAFMFIPSEALYYDMLIGKVGAGSGDARDLVEYAYRDKHVIIVSPTTFVAYLQTVLQGLRELQIEKDAKDIQKRVGKLGAHIHKFDELMSKVGNSLGTTVNHYNNAYTELGKIDKDVVKISDTSPGVDPQLLEKPISREE